MRYSFVVPIYEDGALARSFCVELERVFRAHLGTPVIADDVEVIFVDDGSRDESVSLVKATCDEFPFARVVVLSRSFGRDVAISCGYREARGSYVGMLSVDQEDPADQVLVLVKALEQGDHDIVHGAYANRKASLATSLFNAVVHRITGHRPAANASTARVMNRDFLDAYNALSERSRYLTGLELWLGFRHGTVPLVDSREQDESSRRRRRKHLRATLDSVLSFSDYPLRLAAKVGFLIVLVGMSLVVALIIDRLFFQAMLPGYLSTITAIVLLGGVQVMVTGVACLYIGRILAEVQGRPVFLVRETFGFTDRDGSRSVSASARED
jgi:dolichol-phosphate mannosyltransferase